MPDIFAHNGDRRWENSWLVLGNDAVGGGNDAVAGGNDAVAGGNDAVAGGNAS